MAEALDSGPGLRDIGALHIRFAAGGSFMSIAKVLGLGPGEGGIGRYSEESTKRDQRKLEQQLRTQSGLPSCLLDSSRRQPGVRCSASLTAQQPLAVCAPEPVEDLI